MITKQSMSLRASVFVWACVHAGALLGMDGVKGRRLDVHAEFESITKIAGELIVPRTSNGKINHDQNSLFRVTGFTPADTDMDTVMKGATIGVEVNYDAVARAQDSDSQQTQLCWATKFDSRDGKSIELPHLRLDIKLEGDQIKTQSGDAKNAVTIQTGSFSVPVAVLDKLKKKLDAGVEKWVLDEPPQDQDAGANHNQPPLGLQQMPRLTEPVH